MKYWIVFVLMLSAASSSYATLISATPADALYSHDRNALDEDICPPQTIVSTPITIYGNTGNSTHNYDLSCVYTGSAGDDIYALSLSCRGTVTVSLCGSGYDTALEIRHGTNYFDCPGSQTLVCNDDFCGLQSQASFNIEAGEFYFIIVSGYWDDWGAYTLNVTANLLPPVNDNCSGVTTISSLPFEQAGSTTCAANDYNSACSFSNAPDVIYKLLLPCAANVTATTCGHPLMDDIISVWAYDPCPGVQYITCNDDNCANYQSSVSFFAGANTPYYIEIDGFGSNAGYYVLQVTNNDAHPEDVCPGVPITSFPATVSGNTGCLHQDYPQDCAYGANDALYTFTVPDCRRVTASLCGSNYDAAIEVRTGSGCPGDSIVTCRDDWYCGPDWTLTPTVVFDAAPGYAYQIFVSGYNGATGTYQLYVDAPPCPVVPPVTDMVALPDIANGNMQLYWAPVPGTDYYLVSHSDDMQNWTPGDPCFTNSYTDVGALANSARRFYRVVAVDTPEEPNAPILATKPVRHPAPLPAFNQLPPYDYSISRNK